MNVIIQSDSEMPGLFREFELLTHAARVTLTSIVVDEARHEITIPMQRRGYERKRFLFFGERYRLISPELIESELVVRNVASYRIDDPLGLPAIQLLFGVAIKNKEIYLCSVEEQTGVTAFEMSMKVQSYDIELRDESSTI
jgi:hypothetical protein